MRLLEVKEKTVLFVCGHAEVGKDYLCNRLEKEFHKAIHFAFADKLKESCRIVFPGNNFETDKHLKARLDVPLSGKRTAHDVRSDDYINREILQIVADRFREIDPNCFSKFIEACMIDNNLVLVSDPRMPEDYSKTAILCGIYGYKLKIVYLEREDKGVVNNHVTEQYYQWYRNQADIILHNDFSEYPVKRVKELIGYNTTLPLVG